MQFPEVLLHTGRLELEGADGLSALVELVGQFIVDRDIVEVDHVARRLPDDLAGLFQLGESLQSEEVHFDETGRLNHMAVVLCHRHFLFREVGVGSRRHRHPVVDGVAADDEAAGMDARPAHRSFQHLGILDGVPLPRVFADLRLLQSGGTLDGIRQVHLHAVGQTVRNRLAETVRHVQRQFFHTGNVPDGVLRRHGGISDDVCAVLVAVLVHDPLQHLTASVVIKVGVDIREVDTVGIEETFEQQVVFQRVNLRNSQTVGHYRSGGRAAPRSHHDTQLLAGGIDEVLHNEEVAGETHRLHHVQLESDVALHLVGQRVAIQFPGSVISQLCQIICLELNAVDFLVASQTPDDLLPLLSRKRMLSVLVGRELPVQVVLGKLLPPFLLRSEILGDREERHDGAMVDAVDLHLVEYLQRVRQRLGNVGEDLVHFLPCLEPLLLGVAHTLRIVQVFIRREAQEVVVGLGRFLVFEVAVVGADDLDAVFLGETQQHLVGLLLQGIGLAVGHQRRILHLVPLQLQVEIIAEHPMIPLAGLPRPFNVVMDDLAGYLAGDAGRAHYQVLVVLLELLPVCTGFIIISVHPCLRHELDEVLVTMVVLRQHDEVIA